METELKCEHCGRYMGKAYNTIVATLKCPNTSCKGETRFKIVTSDISKTLNYQFTDKPAQPKAKKESE